MLAPRKVDLNPGVLPVRLGHHSPLQHLLRFLQ